MFAPLRQAVSVLAAASVLAVAAAPALARSFYNPRRYHSTRQALTNRTITKRLGRKPKTKVFAAKRKWSSRDKPARRPPSR